MRNGINDSKGLEATIIYRFSKISILPLIQSQLDMIQSQIGTDVPVMVEPERRDKFPAIALLRHIFTPYKPSLKKQLSAVLPVDPYVENFFFHKLKELEDVLTASDADLSLISVTSTFPSEKYVLK